MKRTDVQMASGRHSSGVARVDQLGRMGVTRLAFSVAMLFVLGGCFDVPKEFQTASRYDYGLIIVLPGIEGPGMFNHDVAVGLGDGGVSSAIEIHDWTTGVPGNFVWNLADFERNRDAAKRLAVKIVNYRQIHPNRPVHLVGHSGGAGIAVLALESLPKGTRIDMALLLAPALSPEYDLSAALRHTRVGVCNFYSENDVTLLKYGTSVFGSIDREFGESAGAVGFHAPATLSAEDRKLYDDRLRQVRWSPMLARRGASGSHIGWTSKEFVKSYLAPIVRKNEAKRPLAAEAPAAAGGLNISESDAVR